MENYDFHNYIFSEDPKTQKNNICVTCLGILQDASHKEQITRIKDKITAAGFEFESFKFAIRLPLSSTIRLTQTRQMMYYLQQNIQKEKEFEEEYKKIENLFNVKDMLDMKVILKWVVAPHLAEVIGAQPGQDERFIINLTYTHTESDQVEFARYESFVAQSYKDSMEEKIQKKIKQNLPPPSNKKVNFTEVNNTNLDRVMTLPPYLLMAPLSDEAKNYLPPVKVTKTYDFDLTCNHANVFIMGNYLKFCRDMSQTPWEVDGKKMYTTSIEEEIAKHITPVFKTKTYKFHTGKGREDIDVRMLGNGRPFVVELIDPRRVYSVTPEDLKAIESKINESTEVNATDLRFSDLHCFDLLKQSESEKIKAYGCICSSTKRLTNEDFEKLNSIHDLTIKQKTPLRVLHRRTLMIRDKVIHRLKAVKLNEHYFVLFVLSSAGTYIKEFCHGDLERTLPNVGVLINSECDILQLDVIKLYEKYDEKTEADFLKVCEVHEP